MSGNTYDPFAGVATGYPTTVGDNVLDFSVLTWSSMVSAIGSIQQAEQDLYLQIGNIQTGLPNTVSGIVSQYVSTYGIPTAVTTSPTDAAHNISVSLSNNTINIDYTNLLNKLGTYQPAGNYLTTASTITSSKISDLSSTVAGYGYALASNLGLYAPLLNPAFTGTATGITAAMVGLGNVSNTSDANKPVSTAQAAAIALKANTAGPTFTGTTTIPSLTLGTDDVASIYQKKPWVSAKVNGSNGVIYASYGQNSFTIAHTAGTGVYIVTMPAHPNTTSYGVVLTIRDTNIGIASLSYSGITTTSFTINCSNAGGTTRQDCTEFTVHTVP